MRVRVVKFTVAPPNVGKLEACGLDVKGKGFVLLGVFGTERLGHRKKAGNDLRAACVRERWV
jgi:hypothetical protein